MQHYIIKSLNNLLVHIQHPHLAKLIIVERMGDDWKGEAE
jgi:hypothetical protein